LLFSFLVSLLISRAIGLRAYAGISWIPIFLLCLSLSRDLLPKFFPLLQPYVESRPAKRNALQRNAPLFLAVWFSCAITFLGELYVIGWLTFFAGGSHTDIVEISDMGSYPLAWLSPKFVVRPDESFPVVLGIIMANSVFYATAVSLAYKVVHAALHRNRTIQLGIGGSIVSEEEDDEL
jgi:hypothetical protein